MWDSANRENAVPKKVLRRSHGFIVMVDVTSETWKDDVRAIVEKLSYENRQDAPRVLVANKIDLANRAFTVVDGHALA
jgi:GTPase SAR1 family protein